MIWQHLAMDHEASDRSLAQQERHRGIHLRLSPSGKGYGHPAPPKMRRAIRTVQARAKEFNVDPAKIGILSLRGGHLLPARHPFDKGKTDSDDPIQSLLPP